MTATRADVSAFRDSASVTGSSPRSMNGDDKPGKGTNAVWRVVVAGETIISSEGMTAILGRDSRFHVCAAVHEQECAEKAVGSHDADLLLLEPVLENADGLHWIKSLAAQFPRTRILVVSRQAQCVYAECAFRVGASGYFLNSGSAQELLHALETIMSGKRYISSPVAPHKVDTLVARRFTDGSHLSNLSDRELQVFSLIAAGHGVGRIAEELGISRKTVETHCEHIKHKLNYRDAKALRCGAEQLLGSL